MHVHRGETLRATAAKRMSLAMAVHAMHAPHAWATLWMPRTTRASASLRMFTLFCFERRQPMLDVHVDVKPQNDNDHDHDGTEAAHCTPGMHWYAWPHKTHASTKNDAARSQARRPARRPIEKGEQPGRQRLAPLLLCFRP